VTYSKCDTSSQKTGKAYKGSEPYRLKSIHVERAKKNEKQKPVNEPNGEKSSKLDRAKSREKQL